VCRGGQKTSGGPQALGYSRGGFGSKLHLICDGRGTPLAAVLTPGQAHESKSAEALVDAVRIGRRTRPKRVAGDKGYSYPFVRRMLRDRRIEPLIPTRSDQPRDPRFDRAAYKRRNVVERLVGWLKERRRLCTRFEKLADSYIAMVKLAFVTKCMMLIHE
jgi:transposase